MDVSESAEIEFLILANHVEAVNGLLYISGGGWTEHHRIIQPRAPVPTTHLGIGISVLIPWAETNRPHLLAIRLENEDATVALVEAEAQVTVGRPPTIQPGFKQHAVLAIAVDTAFPTPGGYRVVARLDDDRDVKSWPFRVHDIQAPAMVMPPRL